MSIRVRDFLNNLVEPVNLDDFIKRFGEKELKIVDEYVSKGKLNLIDNVISIRNDDIKEGIKYG